MKCQGVLGEKAQFELLKSQPKVMVQQPPKKKRLITEGTKKNAWQGRTQKLQSDRIVSSFFRSICLCHLHEGLAEAPSPVGIDPPLNFAYIAIVPLM